MSSSKICWLFSPLLIFGLAVPLWLNGVSPFKVVFGMVILHGVAFGLLAILDRQRFLYAFRGFTALVFLGICTYLIHEFMLPDKQREIDLMRRRPSASKALLLLATVGSPSLWFTVTGQTPNSNHEQ